jgi:hypothetical protein
VRWGGGGEEKGGFRCRQRHCATHSSQANASVRSALILYRRGGAGMGKGGEGGVEEEAKRRRKGSRRRWNGLC